MVTVQTVMGNKPADYPETLKRLKTISIHEALDETESEYSDMENILIDLQNQLEDQMNENEDLSPIFLAIQMQVSLLNEIAKSESA